MNVVIDTISPESKGSRLADNKGAMLLLTNDKIRRRGVDHVDRICDPVAVAQFTAEKLLNF